MTNLVDVLQNNILFKDLSADELERICKLIFLRAYAEGRTLFFEGTPGEVMYLIHAGRVAIVKTGRDKKEIALAMLTPGSFFGEMSILDAQPRSASAKIVEDAELVVITKKAFDQMLETDPGITSKILIALLKAVFARLRSTDEKFKALNIVDESQSFRTR
ncbi:MAG: cyclic nucleotide-binding domain-containing protein [Candidatus Edwardsbacteria bacterium]|nr:cyclic nucleotide-binding domain-containing protein [Candidatus Edwardsbacteria bacterium]